MPKCVMNKEKKPEKQKEIVEEKTIQKKAVEEKTVVEKQVTQETATEKPALKKEVIQEKIVQAKPTETEPIKEPFVEKPVHEVVKKVETIAPKQTQKEQDNEFTTTNFSSIRDMATKNLYYPSRAQKMGWSGTTEIKIVIDTNGKLLDAIINKSSGRELLDNSALESVLSLKDEVLPKPKKVTTLVLPISFSIKK